MSKISEQKALEAYPFDIIPDDDTMGFTSSDKNEVIRFGYIKGYDQAMQDFLEKAEKFFNDMYDTMGKPALGKKTIEQFKNYMQDE